MAILPPQIRQRYFSASGLPLSGGKLYTYEAGTTTPQITYTDATETSSNTNPIILDANGECDLWMGGAKSYKVKLTDSADVEQWTVDNVNQSSITSLASADYIENLGITCSVSSNALTINVKAADGSTPSIGNAVRVGFRSSSLSNGLPSLVTIQSALSMTVSSGSTLGHTSGVDLYIYVYLINNDGVAEIAVSGTYYTEESAKSTTAEGGAGGADSGSTIYSVAARTNKAIRLIGRLTSNQAAAGTWAAAPIEIQTGFSAGSSVINTSQIANLAITTAKLDNLSVTTGKIADGAVTRDKLEALGHQISSSSGSFSTTSTSQVDVTNLSVTITTSGRPVAVGLISGSQIGTNYVGPSGSNGGLVYIKRDSTDISRNDFDPNTRVAPGVIFMLDTPSAGTYVYKVQAVSSASTSMYVSHCKLYAYEL
mgnify:FL=1